MSTVYTARPPQEPEVFPIRDWHYHPVYQGLYVFRNGDAWIDVGSQLGHLGQFDVRAFPPDRWIALQDIHGAPLPIAVYLQRFGELYGRWLLPKGEGPSVTPDTDTAARATFPSGASTPPAVGAGPSAGLDVKALFGLASTQATTVPDEHQAQTEDFLDFVQSVLGVVLSERQLDLLRAHTVQALSSPEDEAANVIEENVAAFQSVKNADAQTRQTWRQDNQPGFVKRLGTLRGELFQTLRQWHGDAQKIIAAALPPLTREAAESWVELSTLAVLVAQGKEPGTAAPENLEAMIAKLAHDYAALPSQQRLWIAFAPIALYEIRRSWPTLSPESRETMRAQLAAQFGISMSDAASSSETKTADSPATPPVERLSTADWDRFRKEDSSVDGLQRQWSEALAEGDEHKAAELRAEIDKALQRQEQATQMLSNIASMRHSMMMAVVNNLR
jgi:hypothetical protein